MTISSSLNAGVAGLAANANRLVTISDNIANASTYGYKRVETDFQSLVLTGSGSAGKYSAGGVTTSTKRLVDERGSFITTNNPTDLAIRGRGFLPVAKASEVELGNGSAQMMLTSTGSFRTDSNGFLRTHGGLVLMGWPAGPDGSIPAFPRDTSDGLAPVQINVNQFSGEPTTRVSLGVNLPATSTAAGATEGPELLSVEYYDNIGTSQNLNVNFSPVVPVDTSIDASGNQLYAVVDSGGIPILDGAGDPVTATEDEIIARDPADDWVMGDPILPPEPSNSWTMTITDSAQPLVTVGQYTLSFNDSRSEGGTLASVATVTGGDYSALTGEITVNVAGGPMTIDIGRIGESDGLTQLSNTFAPLSISKDGSPVGNMTSVEVDENGFVYAFFDTGITRRIFQVPLVDLPNPNGLVAGDQQTYTPSPGSGSFYLWDAGDGPTGDVVGYALEQSTTDVAGELTSLIETQRAYTSNAKVIQTVDEMLQETTNIKR